MKKHRRKRLYSILAIVLGISLATSLTMYALGQNVDLYLTPTQLAQHDQSALINHTFRMGGLVEQGSLKRTPNTLNVHFVLTDNQHRIFVAYTGILPTLFREGQGVVIQGTLNAQGQFIATQVLAKHDEKYKPPQSQ